MLAPREQDIIGQFSSTISALHSDIEIVTDMINCLDDEELGPGAGGRLCRFAELLDLLAMRAVRSAISIREIPAAARTPAYEWDLEAALNGRPTTGRWYSTRRLKGVAAGTTFVIDDFWESERGVQIGVIWDTPERRFSWLSPHQFKTCIRLCEE